jgi:hypothetical protein
MNVLLFQLDGKLPNMALMRISHFHRERGDHVVLRRAGNASALEPRMGDLPWHRIYASAIFQSSRALCQRVLELYPHAHVGGTGWDLARDLEAVGISTLGPLDYTIYPKTKYSMGFTQRGCRMECDFCVVPKKEGKVKPWNTIAEIYRGEPFPKQILLLDNDFFGNPQWRERIAELRDGDFKVCFNQGINARMLNDETATAIASVKYKDDAFKRPRIYTAWDGKKDERTLFRGLDALCRAGVKPNQVMVYMLIGHEEGETHADRDYRRRKLREYGVRPYPMPFARSGRSRSGSSGEELVAFQRWCIQRKDQFVPWEEWWGKAKGNPRKLGDRVTLPLFREP